MKSTTSIALVALVALTLAACDSTKPDPPSTSTPTPSKPTTTAQTTGETPDHGTPMTMHLTSTAFEPHGAIPRKYTCEGDDISPPLSWSGAPEGTKSFALLVYDPDAPDPANPKMTWVHWVLFDIPADVNALGEAKSTALPAGTREGTNDWKKTGYGGPCPPIGRHRYFLTLYALDTTFGDGLKAPTRDELLEKIKGHVLAEAELMGTYQKG